MDNAYKDACDNSNVYYDNGSDNNAYSSGGNNENDNVYNEKQG